MVISFLPYTIANYLSGEIHTPRMDTSRPEFREAADGVRSRLDRLKNTKGKESVDHFHRRLGKIMWEYCGMARNESGLNHALELLPELRQDLHATFRFPAD